MFRRKWKWKSYKTMGIIILLLAAAGLGGGSWYLFNAAATLPEQPNMQSVSEQEESKTDKSGGNLSLQTEIVLKKVYVCGVESEQTVHQPSTLTKNEIEENYPDWEIYSYQDYRIELHQQVNDISPLCKQNGYFGLTTDQILALFSGPPSEENIIQTFYQIDTEKLKSHLPKGEIDRLYKGIRIHDMAEYFSVLSTYGEYIMSGEDF